MTDSDRLRWALGIMDECTGELLRHIGVPYIVGPCGVEQSLCEVVCMVTGRTYEWTDDGVAFSDR